MKPKIFGKKYFKRSTLKCTQGGGVRGGRVRVYIGPPRQISKDLLIKMQ
jgi:hypothetical protein